MSTSPLDAELSDLWGRRSTLNESDAVRLYKIVVSTLMGFRPAELASLPEDRSIYVENFYQDKVYFTEPLSRCDHTGALMVFYRRYLLDEIRSLKSRSKVEVSETQNPDDESPPIIENFSIDDDSDDGMKQLEESGYSISKVAALAVKWLADSEEWVRIFVAFSNCPDADQSEPLVHLAKRKGIRSQAYKAEKLGFNWRGGDTSGFGETLIGRWIRDAVGIELAPENSMLILGALKILCLQALLWAEQQEVAQ
jgi:hypothetical protein